MGCISLYCHTWTCKQRIWLWAPGPPKQPVDNYVDPPVGWGSTYCFTDVRVGVGVGVGVSVGVGVGVHVTPITKRTPAQIFFGRHVFCSPGHWLSIFAMTLTFALKVKP